MTIARFDAKNHLILFARRTRLIINWSAFGVVLLFGWLRLRGVEVLPVVRTLPAMLLLRASLVLYYSSWLAGATFEINTQELVYARAPTSKGQLPMIAIVTIGVIVALFTILCAITSFPQFLLFLMLFWLVNILAWRYLITRLLPPVWRASSAYFYELNNAAKLDQLAFVRVYLTGRWQRARFVTGFLLLLVVNSAVQTGVSSRLAAQFGFAEDAVLAFAVAIFLAIVEGWVWMMRLRTRIAIDTIEQLHHRYREQPAQ